MKKLLFILSAVLVSGTSVFAGLNPYAYNLKSEWNLQTQTFTVHFTLNDHPNTDQKIVNGKPTNETGIQIFALDRNNKSKLYCIYMVPAADINAHIKENDFQYDIDIPINGRDLVTGEALPTGKDLTFAVRVQGLNKTNKSAPSAPIYADDSNRPFSCHGVAVNNNQDSPDFGAVYVTEAANDSELSGTWDWLKGKGKAILQYTPKMRFEASYRKSSAFSDRKKHFWNPIVFVCRMMDVYSCLHTITLLKMIYQWYGKCLKTQMEPLHIILLFITMRVTLIITDTECAVWM